MLTRQQLSDWMRVRRHADEEIRDMCRSQTTSVFNAWTGQLQSAITGMRGSRISATDIYFIDFNNSDPMRRTSIAGLPSGSTVSTSAVGESTPAERDAAAAASPSLGPARVPYANPTWSTISSRCQNSITAATDQLDTMIAREVTRSNTASNRNLAELRNERRRYDMEKRIFEFKNLCQRLSVYRLAQQACSHAADASTYPRESRALCSSSFRTGYPEIQSALTDLQAAIAGTPDRQGWNQLATQNTLDAITAQGQPISDEIYMPETIALPAAISLSGSQTFCNSLPTQAQHVTLITSGN
jgi:hypothetical protein